MWYTLGDFLLLLLTRLAVGLLLGSLPAQALRGFPWWIVVGFLLLLPLLLLALGIRLLHSSLLLLLILSTTFPTGRYHILPKAVGSYGRLALHYPCL